MLLKALLMIFKIKFQTKILGFKVILELAREVYSQCQPLLKQFQVQDLKLQILSKMNSLKIYQVINVIREYKIQFLLLILQIKIKTHNSKSPNILKTLSKIKTLTNTPKIQSKIASHAILYRYTIKLCFCISSRLNKKKMMNLRALSKMIVTTIIKIMMGVAMAMTKLLCLMSKSTNFKIHSSNSTSKNLLIVNLLMTLATIQLITIIILLQMTFVPKILHQTF